MTARADAARATGERLLAAAWQRFAEHPYEQVLLRDVAADAGVTVQTLHARFGSKEALFTAAYTWFGLEELRERPATPTSDVARAVRQLYDRYERHGRAVLRMLSQEERLPAVRRMTDAGRAYHSQWVATTFAPLLAAEPDGAAARRRLHAIGAATDLLIWKLLRLDKALPRRQAERVVVALVGGARPADGK